MLYADAEHRRQLYALSQAEVQARIAGDEAEAARLHAGAGNAAPRRIDGWPTPTPCWTN